MAGSADRAPAIRGCLPYGASKCPVFNPLQRPKIACNGSSGAFRVCLSSSREELMERMKLSSLTVRVTILATALSLAGTCRVQDQSSETPREATAQAPEQPRQKADGERHGLPIETYAVAPGTKFLVRLEDELGTKGTQENAKFKVKTLEPLEAGSGIYLPPGAEIHGHISHVEPAGVAGRAKRWLTFDEMRTTFGSLPIVAEVVSVPGDHSVKSANTKEGLIEGRSSNQHDSAEAAAAGAAIGAVKG